MSIEESVTKAVVPVIIPGLTFIGGIVVLLVISKRDVIFPWLFRKKNGGEHRQRVDDLTAQFLQTFKESTQAQQRMADFQEQTVEILKENGNRLEKGQEALERALRDIHGRIDDLYRKAS